VVLHCLRQAAADRGLLLADQVSADRELQQRQQTRLAVVVVELHQAQDRQAVAELFM
jgi:hypothetical protein